MSAHGSWTAEQAKEHIEAILVEKDRALSMAGDEREKAAAALRNEQQRALDQADSERHRAAEKLRDELARQIDEGDDRLREHISQQFQQINAALVSSEKLEIERFLRAEQGITSLESKLDMLRHSAELGQTKFEEQVKGSFAQVNEFRGSLDDLSKQMATRRELESMSLTINAKLDDWISQQNNKFEEINKTVQDLRSRLDTGPAALHALQVRADLGQGRGEGAKQNQAALYALIVAIAGFLGIVIYVTNALTGQ